MAWYLIAYLTLFAIAGVAGIVDDVRSCRSRAFIAGTAVALVIGISCILAFAVPSLGHVLGAWLWPLLGFAVLMEIISVASDLRDLSRNHEAGRTETTIITLLVIAVTVPAYVMGAAAAARPGS